MKVLVVDDEALVRSELVYTLGKVAPDCAITEAADAVEAVRLLAASAFDVAFLDINLPGFDGLAAAKVIAALPSPPHVVFVTADDSRALDAFELAAVDYVVKPVSPARLARAVERVRTLREKSSSARDGAPSPSSRVALEDGDRTRLVKVADIRYVEAKGHLVTARVFDADLRWRGSLAEAAARLEPAGFLRVHRAYLVNPDRVVEIEPFFGGSYLLRVDDRARSEVPVSRNALPTVRKMLGL